MDLNSLDMNAVLLTNIFVAQPRIILIANKAEDAFIGPYLNDCYDLGVGDPVFSSDAIAR